MMSKTWKSKDCTLGVSSPTPGYHLPVRSHQQWMEELLLPSLLVPSNPVVNSSPGASLINENWVFRSESLRALLLIASHSNGSRQKHQLLKDLLSCQLDHTVGSCHHISPGAVKVNTTRHTYLPNKNDPGKHFYVAICVHTY